MVCRLTDPITTYLLHCYYVIEIKGFICVLAKNLRWRQRQCILVSDECIYKYIYTAIEQTQSLRSLCSVVCWFDTIFVVGTCSKQQSSSFTFWLWLFRLWMVVYFLLSWSFQLLTTYSVVRREHAKGSLDQIQRRLPSRALSTYSCILLYFLLWQIRIWLYHWYDT